MGPRVKFTYKVILSKSLDRSFSSKESRIEFITRRGMAFEDDLKLYHEFIRQYAVKPSNDF